MIRLFAIAALVFVGTSTFAASSGLMCVKHSNGLFYPAHRASGAIVGEATPGAGFNRLWECQATLATATDGIACFKHGNGLFYPTHAATGQSIGSRSPGAGYSAFADCLESIL